MSTAIIMARLQTNWAEVDGIKRAFLYEPETPIDEVDLPAVYPVQLGRMINPIPATSAGQYVVTREYIYRVLIEAATKASTESGDEGALVDKLAIDFIDNALDYFMLHPRLSTIAGITNDLGYLANDILVRDSGAVFRKGPGGADYRAVDYTLTIAERRIPTVKRIG